MRDHTMAQAAAAALADCFLPDLEATEDLDSFEASLAAGSRALAASALSACIERFDRSLRSQAPPGWRAHEVAPRTLVTLVGEVSYRRTVYLDEHGCRRAWADELLGVRPRARLSAGAFLWLARRSAEVSFRKAAADFEAMSGARVSHVTAMRCAREEGALLLAAAPEGPGLSCEGVRVEVDGLWVALQRAAHREEALPRFLYEQSRERSSMELKVASAYAAKLDAGRGRRRRAALAVVASAEPPEEFFERVRAQMAASFELDDVRRVHYGADGGAWCGPERLRGCFPPTCASSSSWTPSTSCRRSAGRSRRGRRGSGPATWRFGARAPPSPAWPSGWPPRRRGRGASASASSPPTRAATRPP